MFSLVNPLTSSQLSYVVSRILRCRRTGLGEACAPTQNTILNVFEPPTPHREQYGDGRARVHSTTLEEHTPLGGRTPPSPPRERTKCKWQRTRCERHQKGVLLRHHPAGITHRVRPDESKCIDNASAASSVWLVKFIFGRAAAVRSVTILCLFLRWSHGVQVHRKHTIFRRSLRFHCCCLPGDGNKHSDIQQSQYYPTPHRSRRVLLALDGFSL